MNHLAVTGWQSSVFVVSPLRFLQVKYGGPVRNRNFIVGGRGLACVREVSTLARFNMLSYFMVWWYHIANGWVIFSSVEKPQVSVISSRTTTKPLGLSVYFSLLENEVPIVFIVPAPQQMSPRRDRGRNDAASNVQVRMVKELIDRAVHHVARNASRGTSSPGPVQEPLPRPAPQVAAPVARGWWSSYWRVGQLTGFTVYKYILMWLGGWT